tara:strand:+ start:65 stop:499 length:435 start_codon:yes stop_codon:yes gene_type:complete
MLPKWHLLWGVILSISLLFTPLSTTAVIIIFISSGAIDIDHYLRFVIKTKKFSPKKFWKWSMDRRKKWNNLSPQEKKQHSRSVFIFHNIELLFVLILLSYFSPIFFWVFLGILFHLFLDFVHALYRKNPLTTKFSLIYVLETNK